MQKLRRDIVPFRKEIHTITMTPIEALRVTKRSKALKGWKASSVLRFTFLERAYAERTAETAASTCR